MMHNWFCKKGHTVPHLHLSNNNKRKNAVLKTVQQQYVTQSLPTPSSQHPLWLYTNTSIINSNIPFLLIAPQNFCYLVFLLTQLLTWLVTFIWNHAIDPKGKAFWKTARLHNDWSINHWINAALQHMLASLDLCTKRKWWRYQAHKISLSVAQSLPDALSYCNSTLSMSSTSCTFWHRSPIHLTSRESFHAQMFDCFQTM